MKAIFCAGVMLAPLSAFANQGFPNSLLFCNEEGGPGDWNWSLPEYYKLVSRNPMRNAAGDTVIHWERGPEAGEMMVIIQRATGEKALLVCGLM